MQSRGTRVFAYGEDTHACRLRASSTRSARSMRTHSFAYAQELGSKPRFAEIKKQTIEMVVCGTRVFAQGAKIFRFATGEQTPRWLSLKCEPKFCPDGQNTGSKPRFAAIKKQTTESVVFLTENSGRYVHGRQIAFRVLLFYAVSRILLGSSISSTGIPSCSGS